MAMISFSDIASKIRSIVSPSKATTPATTSTPPPATTPPYTVTIYPKDDLPPAIQSMVTPRPTTTTTVTLYEKGYTQHPTTVPGPGGTGSNVGLKIEPDGYTPPTSFGDQIRAAATSSPIPPVPKGIGPVQIDVTKPVFDLGQRISEAWMTHIAPPIEQAIDTVPYLGPKTLHRIEGGQVVAYTAPPLTDGGTRLKPNYKGDFGHDFAKGAAVDFVPHTVEFLTAIPLGVERAGRMAWSDPGGAAGMVGGGLVMVGEGTVQAAKEDPARFLGEMAIGTVVGAKTGPFKQAAKSRVYRAAAHVDPYFERGMKVYTGTPGIVDAITREQSLFDPHPTLKGTTKFELDPKIFEAPRSYYHGTSLREGGMIETALVEGRLRVGGANPAAVPETWAATKALEQHGKVGPAYQAVEHALFLGPPDTGYATFSSGAFVKIRGTVRSVPDALTSLAKTRESLVERGSRVSRSLQRDLSMEAYGEYLSSPRGEILVSPKPISGYTWKGLAEHEYVMKPGTDLFPVHSGRSRFFHRFGITKGSSYTIHPSTGQILEIVEFSTKRLSQQPPLPPVLIDLPRLRGKLPSLPGFSTKPLAATTTASATKKQKAGGGGPTKTLEEVLAGPSSHAKKGSPTTSRPWEVDARPPAGTTRPRGDMPPSLERVLRGPDLSRRTPTTTRPTRRDVRPWEADTRPPSTRPTQSRRDMPSSLDRVLQGPKLDDEWRPDSRPTRRDVRPWEVDTRPSRSPPRDRGGGRDDRSRGGDRRDGGSRSDRDRRDDGGRRGGADRGGGGGGRGEGRGDRGTTTSPTTSSPPSLPPALTIPQAPTRPTTRVRQTEQTKRVGRRAVRKDPYDWIVQVPVPDVAFILGGPGSLGGTKSPPPPPALSLPKRTRSPTRAPRSLSEFMRVGRQ